MVWPRRRWLLIIAAALVAVGLGVQVWMMISRPFHAIEARAAALGIPTRCEDCIAATDVGRAQRWRRIGAICDQLPEFIGKHEDPVAVGRPIPVGLLEHHAKLDPRILSELDQASRCSWLRSGSRRP